MTARAAIALAIASVSLPAAGCSGSSAPCTLPGDCPPGERCVAGECRPEVGRDAAPPDGGIDGRATDGGTGTDAGNVCDFVDDGVIQASEMRLQAGLTPSYRVNGQAPVPVDLAGQQVGPDIVWDYSAPLPSDQTVVDELFPVSGTWYAADFPDATYAARLDETLGTLGVFRSDGQSLALLGLVSEEPNRTKLIYAPPIDILRFPIQLGQQFQQQSDSSGTLNFTIWGTEETWDTEVDTAGRAIVPAGTFPVLRVRTRLTQWVPLTLLYVERIVYLYVTECFGIVARITSVDNETQLDFTDAAEYRRLVP